MPVPTLFELARQRLIQNITLLTDVGDIPYSFLEPVLRHIQNPTQLQDLEGKCPQICGETGALWLRFIKRDIPDYATKPHEPRDPRNWSKVYRKLKKDAEREKHEQGEALKQQMRALQNDRAQNKTLIVDSKVGYGAKPNQGFAFGGRSWGLSGAPAKTGKVGMDKLRRGMFDRNRERPKAAQMPAHVLAQRKKFVQPPPRMVRMAENANDSQKDITMSQQASASLAARAERLPSLSKPHITQRPAPPQSTAPQRTSLPAGQQFHLPKLKPSQEAGAAVLPKRKKEEANLFHQPKRRRV